MPVGAGPAPVPARPVPAVGATPVQGRSSAGDPEGAPGATPPSPQSRNARPRLSVLHPPLRAPSSSHAANTLWKEEISGDIYACLSYKIDRHPPPNLATASLGFTRSENTCSRKHRVPTLTAGLSEVQTPRQHPKCPPGVSGSRAHTAPAPALSSEANAPESRQSPGLGVWAPSPPGNARGAQQRRRDEPTAAHPYGES